MLLLSLTKTPKLLTSKRWIIMCSLLYWRIWISILIAWNILELCSCHALLNKAFFLLWYLQSIAFKEQLPLKHAMLSQCQMQPHFAGMTQCISVLKLWSLYNIKQRYVKVSEVWIHIAHTSVPGIVSKGYVDLHVSSSLVDCSSYSMQGGGKGKPKKK